MSKEVKFHPRMALCIDQMLLDVATVVGRVAEENDLKVFPEEFGKHCTDSHREVRIMLPVEAAQYIAWNGMTWPSSLRTRVDHHFKSVFTDGVSSFLERNGEEQVGTFDAAIAALGQYQRLGDDNPQLKQLRQELYDSCMSARAAQYAVKVSATAHESAFADGATCVTLAVAVNDDFEQHRSVIPHIPLINDVSHKCEFSLYGLTIPLAVFKDAPSNLAMLNEQAFTMTGSIVGVTSLGRLKSWGELRCQTCKGVDTHGE